MTVLGLDPFWSGIEIGELRLPVCNTCGHRWMPPGSVCPRCLSPDVGWQSSGGRGVVTAACAFHRHYFPNFALPLPYTVLLVRLAEGPLFYGNPVDSTAPPAIGTRVRAIFVAGADGRIVLRFASEGEQA